MAFTSTDLANVEQAIVDIATGQRKVEVTIQGKSVTYQKAQIADLISLKATIQMSIGNIPHRVYAKNGGRSS